ncbi:MAG: PP2C family protein-serine/threonine phosphatase [Phycisphaerales bacterium]
MPETTAQPSATPAGVSLSCMEIWGGSAAARDAVSTPGVDFWVHSRPHEGDAAGGDIHYVSVCGSGRYIRAALADVAGHGSVVAELAGNLRSLVRRHINTPDQSRFARALNEEFGDLSERGAFATAVLATYHGPSESLILCNAGHPRPLLYRASSQTWRLFDIADVGEAAPKSLRNLPLGVIPGTAYEQGVAGLGTGDLVLLYTDALIESRDASGEMLGEQGLLELVRSIDFDRERPDSIIDCVLAHIRERQGGAPFDDDVTMVLLRQNGSSANLSMGEKLSVVAKLLGLKKF